MYSFFRNVYSQIRTTLSNIFELFTFRTKPDDEELETLYLNESIDR